jgi:hypothetical protein
VLFTRSDSGGATNWVSAISLANGALSVVSGPSNSGPSLSVPSHVVLEPAANPVRALVSDFYNAQVLAVDLPSGDRSTFDSPGTGSGLTWTRVGPMNIDTVRGRIYMHHTDYPSNLFSRPLAGGERVLVSGANPLGLAVRGSGPPFYYVQAMDVDFATDVGYASSTNNGSIIAVDLVSGDRVIIAH